MNGKYRKAMKDCVVIIPVYMEHPSPVESCAFRNTLKVLGKHPLVLVCPESLDLHVYEGMADKEGTKITAERFADRFFVSVDGYNDLCYSPSLYERFADFRYMLICQLDVWVFRDELDYWCAQGYDYIGAPLYFPYNEKKFTEKFLGIGNGGFCLRRIDHCLSVVKRKGNGILLKPVPLARIYWNYFLYNDAFRHSWLKRAGLLGKFVLKCFGVGNNMKYFTAHHVNEDLLFGTWAKDAWGAGNVRLPDEITAAGFSMEVNAPLLFERNSRKLPFGCHAFRKWNYGDFWAEYIKIETTD